MAQRLERFRANEWVMKEFVLTVGPEFEAALDDLSGRLKINHGDVIDRAMTLLRHAVDADQVKLVKNGVEQNVLVK